MRSLLWSGVRLAVLAALVVFALIKVNLGAVVAHLTVGKLASILAIQPLMLAGFAIAGLRLAMLTAQSPAPIKAGFRAIVLSYGVNLVLPARVSEILKATYLRQHAGTALSSGLAAIFLERVADLLILGMLVLITAAGLLSKHDGLAAWLAAAALILLAGLPRLAPHVGRLVDWIPAQRIRSFFHRFLEHSVERVTHRTFLGVLGLSLLLWMTSLAGVAVVLALAGSIPIGVKGALVVLVASAVGGAVPALPGGFGTYEAAAVFALRGFGYGLDEALALALSMHVAQVAIVCVLAPLIAMRDKTGVRSVIREAMAELRDPMVSERGQRR